MKIPATIKLIAPTESGISKATGNPWQSKEVVFEFDDEDAHYNIFACKTFNKDIIAKVEQLHEGDKVNVKILMYVKARVFNRQDGSEAIIRQNDIGLADIEPQVF